MSKLSKWVLDDDDENALEFRDKDAVEKDGGELSETIVTYDDAEGDDVTSFSDFLTNFVSGTKIGRWFKNFYAGCQYILHVGSLVNNCVTDNANLPLSAAQGKVLMDELTQVKSDLTELDTNLNDNAYGYIRARMTSIAESIVGEFDYDDLNTVGFYSCNGGNNRPASGWVQMIVMRADNNAGYIYQIAFTSGKEYMRNSSNYVWTDWITLH